MCRACGRTSSLLSGNHHPFRSSVCSPVAGTEALCAGLKLTLFSLCVFPSLSTGSFASKEERAEVSGTHVLTEVWCTTCVGVCSFAQLQPTVTSFTCCGCSRSSAKFLCGTDVIAVVRGPQFLSFFLQRDQDCKTGTEFIGRQLAKKKFI